MKAVVLLSGGMDSAVALAQAIEDGSSQTLALSIEYGSRHQVKEIAAARMIAAHYRKRVSLRHMVVQLPNLFDGSGSSLMGESEIPAEEYHDPEKESPSSTVVPFRNAMLISAATAIAASNGFDRVYVAVHMSDASGFAYPDCTPEFMGPMSSAVYTGTHREVRLVVPFQWMAKYQIVKRGADFEVPFNLTWSCYRGGRIQCGQCPTCLERIKAFRDARFIDPVSYAVPVQWSLECKPYGNYDN